MCFLSNNLLATNLGKRTKEEVINEDFSPKRTFNLKSLLEKENFSLIELETQLSCFSIEDYENAFHKESEKNQEKIIEIIKFLLDKNA